LSIEVALTGPYAPAPAGWHRQMLLVGVLP
jgi:hypothetical protein